MERYDDIVVMITVRDKCATYFGPERTNLLVLAWISRCLMHMDGWCYC